MNCIIVDDEKKAREVLGEYISKVNQLELSATFRDPIEALSFLNGERNPDFLIFLDINMPGLNGIQFIKSLNKKYNIIFTTAYDEYALDGYENDVIDYLLKPIRFERFLKAVYKVFGVEKSVDLKNKPETTKKFIMVKSGHNYHKIMLDDVTYLKKDSNYIEIYSTKDRKVLFRENMNAVFDHFPESEFIRVHKSYVISKSKLKVIKAGTVVLDSGDKIPLGISYKDDLIAEFPFLK